MQQNVLRLISGQEPYTSQELQAIAAPFAEHYEIHFEEMGEGGGLFSYGLHLMMPALTFAVHSIIKPWAEGRRSGLARRLWTCSPNA